MRKEYFAEVLGDINEKHIAEARVERKAKRPVWVKWSAMAACLCLVVVGAFNIPNWQSNPHDSQDFTAQYYPLSETEHLCVEIIKVENFTYQAKVVDTGNNSVYPLGEEIAVCVNFGETNILLDKEEYFDDTVDDIYASSLRLENIGWDVGTILYVEFNAYTENNKLLAAYIENIDKNETCKIKITVPAGSTEAFVYSDEQISATGKKIIIWAGDGLGDTEVILSPVNKNVETGYVATYLTHDMPVEFDAVEGEWFKIGISVQNNTDADITVYIEVEGVEVRIE